MKAPSIGLLRNFAKELGSMPVDTRRPFVVEAIRKHLLSSKGLRAYLDSLSQGKRDIVAPAGGRVTQVNRPRTIALEGSYRF